MTHQNGTILRLRRFLEKLQSGDFSEQLSDAFQQLNVFLKVNAEVRDYFRDEYLGEIYGRGRAGRYQIVLLCDGAEKYSTPSLALLIVEGLIGLYCQVEDEEILALLVPLVLKYRFTDLISVEGTGQNLRLENRNASFLLRIDVIRRDLRAGLLLLALRKYSGMLVAESPPGQLELPSIIQRLNHVIQSLLKFEDRDELSRHTPLSPFALADDIVYSSALALRVFDLELHAIEYDERMFSMYRIPLFPDIQPDKLEFLGNKIVFTNEGKGCLPPASIRVMAFNDEFELGKLNRAILSNEKGELFIVESEAFANFLHSKNPNSDIKVVFSFKKFGRSYDFTILAQSVGAWLEKVPRTPLLDRGLPYAIPLRSLDDKSFERLCYWLVSEDLEGRFRDFIWLNENGGGERGRDVLATEVATGKKYVFQCKCVDRFTPGEIEQELGSFAKHVASDPTIKPDVYVLFFSAALTDLTKSRGDKLAQQIGMEIEYWFNADIDRRVRTNPNVLERFWRVIQEVDH